MFRKRFIIVAIIVSLELISAHAQTGTAISSATTITSSGSYYLTANVSYIIVGSPSDTDIVVSLDMNGYNIANSSTSGNGTYLIRNYATLNLTNTSATTSLLNGNSKTISTSGRGIRNETSGTVTVDGNIQITNCKSSGNGAAIYNQHSMTINNGVIASCSAAYAGAIANEGILIINGGTIERCSASTHGGAIYNKETGSITMNNGEITGCTSSKAGGAIINGGTLNINGGTISSCTATTTGGAIHNQLSGTLTITGGIIESCKSKSSTSGGGAIFNNNICTICGGIIQGCSTTNAGSESDVDGGAGGAIFNTADASLSISGSGTIKECSSNSTYTGGGAIYNEGSFTLSGCTIQGCHTKTTAGNGGAIYNKGASCSIEGGVIDNCYAYSHGGGIFNKSSCTLEMSGGIIKNCYVTSSENGDGGGVSNYGTFNMTGGKIGVEGAGNSAKGRGGGVQNVKLFNMSGGEIAYNLSETYVGGGIDNNTGNAILTLSGDAWIHHNTAYREGGGINCGGGATLNMSDEATISYNVVTNGLPDTGVEESDLGGGGVGVGHMGSNTFVMSGGHIVHNTCYGNGGGLYMRNTTTGSGSSKLKITGGEIANNHAYLNPNGKCGNGGGVYTNGPVEVTGGVIDYNDCVGTGGGFCLASSSNFDMEGGTISNNSSGSTGGGMYIGGGKLNMSTGTVTANTSATDGGGFYVNRGNVEITGGTIQGNEAGKDAASGDGGGFYSAGGTVKISNATISSNHADNGNGGGLYSAAAITVGTTASGSGAIVSDNHAKNGAGFYVAQNSGTTSTIQGGSTISDNIATEDGAGAYIASGKLSVLFSDIKDNEATHNGGGIYAGQSSIVTMSDGDISDNQAKNGGGIYLASGADMKMSNGLIRYNKAVSAEGVTIPTAYHAGSDTSIQGVGGGIYLSSGTSDAKKTKLTFDLPETVGIYGNTATLGADEIFADGLHTQITVPDVEGMDLKEYPAKVDGWYEDYITNDTHYADGTKQAPAGTPVRRYEDYFAYGERPYLVPYTTASEENKYICLRLGGTTDLVIIKSGMRKGESAIFKVSKTSEKILYTVVITAGEDGSGSAAIRGLAMGEYTVQETGWSWAYTPDPSEGKITQDISRYNTFTFTNSPKENIPRHGEAGVNNKFVDN